MKIRIVSILTGLMLTSAVAFAQIPGDDSPRRQPVGTAPVDRVLKVPVILDGVEYPAGYILPDHSLSFVLERTGPKDHDHVVYAFSSREMADNFMREQSAKRTAASSPTKGGISANAYPTCYWTDTTSSWFHKAVGCGSSGWLVLSYGDQFYELDSLGWNNSISCVRAACQPNYTVLYSCRDFQMTSGSNCADPDRLAIAGGDIVTDLNYYGFNNRTSSIDFESTP